MLSTARTSAHRASGSCKPLVASIHPLRAAFSARRSITVGRDGRNRTFVLAVVPQAQRWIIERFGKFSRVAHPGLNFVIPFVESVAYKRSLKESTIAIHPQGAITRDNVHVKLDGAVYVQVLDAEMASYGIENPEFMITVLAQSAMRKEVGNLELDELFLEREKLNEGVARVVDEATKPWGVRVTRYEIADITVDLKIREAMEQQSNAERLRRAEVLESEGYRQRLINQSEGDRQSAINKAQGEAESIKLEAHAEAERVRLAASAEADAIRLRASATADGITSVAVALKGPGGPDAMRQRLAEEYLKNLSAMAQNSKLVIVPDRPNDVSAVLATALSVGDVAKSTL